MKHFIAKTIPLILLMVAACLPSSREDYDIVFPIHDVELTNANPGVTATFRLLDDPFVAEHENDLQQIAEIHLSIDAPRNGSSRLKIGVYVSAEAVDDPKQSATKIADFNLAAATPTDGPASVRVFNESRLRNLVLSEKFLVYVLAEADMIDLTIAELDLVVTAKFVL